MNMKWEETMKNEDLITILSLAYLLAMLNIILMSVVSAFPFQLLPNGTLIDLNGTEINGTPVDFVLFNDTIYIIPKNFTNQTIIYNITNVENITYVNQTCINCSNYYNETINNTYYINEYGYNKSELNDVFLKISDYNSWKDGLNYATLDELNNSVSETKEISTIWLWLSVLGLFLIEVAIIGFIVYMTRAE